MQCFNLADKDWQSKLSPGSVHGARGPICLDKISRKDRLLWCFACWKASETYSRPALVDTDSITSVGSRKKECDETYKRFTVAGRRAQKARAPAKISLLATFFIEDTAPSFVDSACYQFPRIFHLIVVYSRCPTPAARLL